MTCGNGVHLVLAALAACTLGASQGPGSGEGSMLNVKIETVDHTEQRYDTVGDYYVTPSPQGPVWQFRISRMANPDHGFLVAIHELVEWRWAQRHGVSLEAIDAFDLQFERERAEGLHGEDDEPGDDPRAPYHAGHKLASIIERAVASMLGVDWREYERAFDDLPDHPAAQQRDGSGA